MLVTYVLTIFPNKKSTMKIAVPELILKVAQINPSRLFCILARQNKLVELIELEPSFFAAGQGNGDSNQQYSLYAKVRLRIG
jgi:hypothetical protein